MRNLLCAVALLVTVPVAAEEVAKLVQIQGGGFIFNYRLGEAFYGVVLKPQRALPEGTLIEASFENPAGGDPYLVKAIFSGSPQPIALQTPPVKGVKAGHDYAIVIRLKEPGTEIVIGELNKSMHADVDQDVLPDKPVTVGPGYHRNPEAGPEPFKR